MTKTIKEGRTYILDFVCKYCGCEFRVEPPKDIFYRDRDSVKITRKVVKTAFINCPLCHKQCVSISYSEEEPKNDNA